MEQAPGTTLVLLSLWPYGFFFLSNIDMQCKVVAALPEMGLHIAAVKESLFPCHIEISNMLLHFAVLSYLIPEKSVHTLNMLLSVI